MNELPVQTDPLPFDTAYSPFSVSEGGLVRVGNSRVGLDLVVEQYENGMTPEDIVRAYDSLKLADVHAAIAYYLRHPMEVRAYMQRRWEEAQALQATIESKHACLSREAYERLAD